MPPLQEGSLMYMPNTMPGISLTQQRRLLHVEDSILMGFPETGARLIEEAIAHARREKNAHSLAWALAVAANSFITN